METKTNVPLTEPGADEASRSRVMPLLQKKGLNVVAAQLPLTSVDADIAETNNRSPRCSRAQPLRGVLPRLRLDRRDLR